jgi:uncharacterized CHY-type Zn-finger protein
MTCNAACEGTHFGSGSDPENYYQRSCCASMTHEVQLPTDGGTMNGMNQGDDLLAHASVCAYCLWRFTRDAYEAITTCPSCATPYHTECFDENGGCATFGCPMWVSGQDDLFLPPPPPPPPVSQILASVRSEPQSPPLANNMATPNFCSQCGNPLEQGYAFCANCGTRISS